MMFQGNVEDQIHHMFQDQHNIVGNVIAVIRQRNIQRRHLRDHMNPFLEDPEHFRKLYRLYPVVAYRLCNILTPYLEGERSHHLPVHIQVLLCLSLFASGSFQTVIGQSYFHPVSQPAVSKCLEKFVKALYDVSGDYINFPKTPEERHIVQDGFRRTIRVPGILGIIDCVVVKMMRPSESEEAFFHYKHGHSLNVQVISDSNSLITNVCPCPGSANDRFIWNNCKTKSYMESLRANFPNERFYMIGDGGYTRSQVMITPNHHALPGTPESLLTSEIGKTRCQVEQLFGVLCNVWRVGSKGRKLHYDPVKSSYIFTAAAVLHNFRLLNGIALDIDYHNRFLGNNLRVPETYEAGVLEHNNILNTYYNN